MKFWQRVYFSTLLLFVVFFYMSIYMVSNFAYRTSLNSERERSFGEAGFIAVSLEREIAVIIENDGSIVDDGYHFFQRYADYYESRDIYLELWKKDDYLIGNIPGSSMRKYETSVGEQLAELVEYGQNRFMLVASSFMSESDSYTLIYTHNLKNFTDDHASLTRFLIISGMALAVLLATMLYFILRHLSRPIEKLDEATRRISGGDYSMRVPVFGKDELAAFAWSFNSMADEIETKIHELQSTAEQKQRFIDNLAHELRTPLTTIRGYAEYLKNANINEDDRIESLDFIISESVRVAAMANKLLDIALLRNNTLEIAEVNVPELFNALAQKLYPKLSEKRIKLETSGEQDIIIGDWDLLETLLYNLLDNAIKTSDEGAAVYLSCLTEKTQCIIEVKDFGKGMPEEHISKLTEPFYRVDKARSHLEGGAGLGLALCEQIVELHGADLEFYSEVGKGTTVRIIFYNSMTSSQ
ncbi:MAG: HAMP domain-containing histidine kinase [Oscillospiraceae bacterium]|nr:HAMP domain-containing histidine kinase [Oscillospiraceae bacterium]